MKKLDFKKFVSIFWNKRLHIIAITLVAIIVGAIYSFYFTTPKYQSYTTLVFVKATEENGVKTITASDVDVAHSLMKTYKELVKCKSILRPTINNLKLNETEETLVNKITVIEVDGTGMLRIVVEDEDPVKAMKIANELTKVFSEKVSEMYANNVYVLDEAEQSITPCNVNNAKNILIFMAIGFLLSIIYAFVAHIFDNTIKNSEDIENSVELTTLVSIPFVHEDRQQGGLY